SEGVAHMSDPSEILILINQSSPEGYFCCNPSLFISQPVKAPKKEQEQATEARVKELETENGQLQEKVTALTQEINILKKLYQDIYGQKQS
ncbi:MAG: hypothetical protein ACR2PX_29065, partial [Endozoicomonas sp.]|uniref:hypothetical protein n=1 Tax=Endozoicomonas sp. TaxID=1892382 RepID=UPI003D9B3D1B